MQSLQGALSLLVHVFFYYYIFIFVHVVVYNVNIQICFIFLKVVLPQFCLSSSEEIKTFLTVPPILSAQWGKQNLCWLRIKYFCIYSSEDV